MGRLPGRSARIAGSRMVYRRRLDAPPERIWRLLVDPAAGFWHPERFEIDPRVGGRIAIDFGPCDDGSEPPVWSEARISRFDPPRVFSYGGARNETRWELSDRPPSKCLLVFEPPEPPLLTIVTGWHATLDSLERVAAGGERFDDDAFAARERELAPHYRHLPGVILTPDTV